MPTATTRLSLTEPLSTDPTTEYRTAATNNAGILDASVLITEGTLASRPTTGLFYGRTYYATDKGLWYFYNGSAWETVLTAGAWTNFTIPSGWTNTGGANPPPRWQQVGNRVFLDGVIVSTTGFSTTVILTGAPAATAATDVIIPTLFVATRAGAIISVGTDVELAPFTASGQEVALTGSYPLD